MNYPQFFIDTDPAMPTFYDELGLTLEDPPAEGPSTAARYGDDQATLDFSGLDFSGLEFGIENIYAPFDGPPHDLILGGPLWETDVLLDHGTSVSTPVRAIQRTRLNRLAQDIPTTSQCPGTDDVDPGSAACQNVASTERCFARDISNTEGPVAERVPQSLSSSSPSVSSSEVETPTNSSYTEESEVIPTASSSPARKSPRQRGSAASSITRKAKTSVEPSGTRQVEESEENTPTAGIPCRYRDCNTGPFYDRETMKRHVREIHLGVRHECPGCGVVLSRKNSVTRHLNATPIGSRCRAEGLRHGWVEDQNGRLKLSVRSRTGRSTR